MSYYLVPNSVLGGEEIQVLLDLLETFKSDSQVISLVFQVILARLRRTKPNAEHILVDSGAEKIVKYIVESVDDYIVGYWGKLLIACLEKARVVTALKRLR